MAGVTDRPFRLLCKKHGAGLVVSEMVSSRPELRHSRKTQLRLNHDGEASPRIVQIAGGDAAMMAEAAKFNVDCGAEIIDINMGCPAKKVCNKAAGSALLKDETLVKNIISSVVNAVNVPVTLKIRTGWDKEHKNALIIARIAESEGIQSLAIHGRTRADKYLGVAEYDTIAAVKAKSSIPIIANGDIDSPQKAKFVLNYTKADAIMIGRAAQGNPWIFNQINAYLNGTKQQNPTLAHVLQTIYHYLKELYTFYGEFMGLRIARKHFSWFSELLENGKELRKHFNSLQSAQAQLNLVLGLN